MKNTDVDTARLTTELQKIPKEDRANHGVIIGYIDFLLAASLFKDFGAEVGASGYGAKIGGSWFTKFENTSAHHRVVAIWSPLPFVVETARKPMGPDNDLGKETLKAVREHQLILKTPGRALDLPRGELPRVRLRVPKL